MRSNEADGNAAVQSLAGPPKLQSAPELRMAKAAAVVVFVLGIPTIAVAAVIAGVEGALSAGLAAALVLAMFGLSGIALSFAARFGPAALMGAALGGFFLRLVAYAGLIVLLRPVEAINGPILAISAALLLIATLVIEAWLITARPGFFWVDAGAGPQARGERKTA